MGPVGLFVSKPGYDVDAYYPNQPDYFQVSSELGKIAAVVGSGFTSLNVGVPLPSVTWAYRPLIMFSNDNFGGENAVGKVVNAGNGSTRYYNVWARPVYQTDGVNGWTSFYISNTNRIDTAPTLTSFYYVIFNLAVDRD